MESPTIAVEMCASATPSVGIVERLPSVLAQEGVAAEWSGSLITEVGGARIEGVSGLGDRFMISAQQGENLPDAVRSAVVDVHQRLVELIGPISMEWAYDGESVWVLQLHVELSPGSGDVFVPGEPEQWQQFTVSRGLAVLHELAETAAKRGFGIEFTESVGATSHAAAIARKFGVPARVRSEH